MAPSNSFSNEDTWTYEKLQEPKTHEILWRGIAEGAVEIKQMLWAEILLMEPNLSFRLRLKTTTSAPSLMVLVLKPFPSESHGLETSTFKKRRRTRKSDVRAIHRPIAVLTFLSENPKLIHRLIASGSIPPPSSSWMNHIKKICISLRDDCFHAQKMMEKISHHTKLNSLVK